jgi:hypothetical protein
MQEIDPLALIHAMKSGGRNQTRSPAKRIFAALVLIVALFALGFLAWKIQRT